VDAGAELDLYASDITRCFPASGRFSTAQREVYTIVLNAQKAVLAAMKPGVDWTDMHRLAERTISQGLIDYGFVRGTVDEIMGSRTVSVFFPHGLGHMIGLAVHDVGGYAKGVERIQEAGIRYLRARVTLQEGMCLTVEPGVYFNDELLSRAKKDEKVNRFIVWEKVDQFRNFGGVRIEDDVAVTATGIDNLTVCPKEIDEIEKLMNE
jgi:Xaa-Pro dipeptidase